MRGKVLKPFSRSLRKKQTDAEKTLWSCLRSRRFQGIKFRRQQSFGPYIVDFCSLEDKLILELDGGQHAQLQKKDAERTEFLKRNGFRVVRIWNNEIFANLEGVLEHIRQHLGQSPSPQPISRTAFTGKFPCVPAKPLPSGWGENE